MKAVRMVAVGQKLQTQEIPLPEVGEKDLLIRIKAAGICHSDVHYRSGAASAGPMPRTLGHEVAGIVEQAGKTVKNFKTGDRVCVHYHATCGECVYCSMGNEQFCPACQMIGKSRDGGYAEYILMPARSVVPLPDDISFAHGAAAMCSSSTCFHALRKARLKPGESAAVFGIGGLGLSAIQLAQAFGALSVYAVDLNGSRLAQAEKFGAIPIHAARVDPVAEIRRLTRNQGVDVALELVGHPQTARQSVLSLGVLGRAALVGLTSKPFEIHPFAEILGKEAEIIGVSDHLYSEIPLLLEFILKKKLDLTPIVTNTIPLAEDAINKALDDLERFAGAARTVIVP